MQVRTAQSAPVPHDPAPFALAPALPPRPIQWRRARRLVAELIDDPSSTDKVFELIDAMGGRGDERTAQLFASHPAARPLLAEKPRLLDRLADRDRLAALPEESFGGAYLAFAQRSGISADGLLDANARALGEMNARLDADRRWFFERLNLIHDLWHVLTGYETDPAAETALLAFSIGQGLANRSLRVLMLAAMVIAPKREGFAFQRFVVQAWRRGRRAAPLLVQPYEQLLARPLDEVRRELRIEPIRQAHPGGLFRADLSPRDVVRVAS